MDVILRLSRLKNKYSYVANEGKSPSLDLFQRGEDEESSCEVGIGPN